MALREIRTYEVSVWSLQDDFIAVLKAAYTEQEGQIQEPKMVLATDGTQTLEFKIPMYIYEKGELVENPIWWTKSENVLAANLRKIKVIFNKDTQDQEVFEFIITKITDEHTDDELYCHVNCEGLAFNELGKVGYKISLSTEQFYEEYNEWFDQVLKLESDVANLENEKADKTQEEEIQNLQTQINALNTQIATLKKAEPVANINYWLNQFLDPWPGTSSNTSLVDLNRWYYEIKMDWNSYSDDVQDDGTTTLIARDDSKIYDDPYVGNWKKSDENSGAILISNEIVNAQEKYRLIDLEESNIYNLTQSIAETFGVFCRYEYEHDVHGFIVGRKIVFYNHFFFEKENCIDITYPYATSSIKREIDSTDTITKLYVKPVDSPNSESDILTIMNVDANRSKEDYLFNFDYLHDNKIIDDIQYNLIPEYESKMRAYNETALILERNLEDLRDKIIKLRAQKTFYENSLTEDTEQLSKNNDLLNSITNNAEDQCVEIGDSNPDTAILIEDKNVGDESYYINITRHGIDRKTLHIYRKFGIGLSGDNPTILLEDTTSEAERISVLEDEITQLGIFETDDFGELVRIKNLRKGDSTSNLVYLTYKYRPSLYYQRVIDTWTERFEKDTQNLSAVSAKLAELETQEATVDEEYKKTLADKREEIRWFEQTMGAALREGYWQPENYTDYGDHYQDYWSNIHNDNITSDDTTMILGSVEKSQAMDYFCWDSKPFDDEQLLTYEIGINQNGTYYPYIILDDLSTILTNDVEENKTRLKKLSFFFDDRFYNSDETPVGEGESENGTDDTNEGVNNIVTRSIVRSEESTTNIISLANKRSFTLGSECQLGFIMDDKKIKPILILTGAEGLGTISEGYVGAIEIYKSSGNDDSTYENQPVLCSWGFKATVQTTEATLYYPRIIIKSTALKTDSKNLSVGYNKTTFKAYEDYYINTKNIEKDPTTIQGIEVPDYEIVSCITFKPESLLAQGDLNRTMGISYIVSNGDTAIYLDAIKVLKENAYPKVSYQVDVNIVDHTLIKKAYNWLAHLVRINDPELKFSNVRGYISKVTLSLDKPWEDEYEIKNYRNKFEDLFSTIIAQTASMQSSAGLIDLVADSFTLNGEIDPDKFKNSLRKVDLNYAFNHGTLTISEENGIWGTSEAGVVAFRGGGIFTSTSKDRNGNWIWNTGIVPQGINADIITTGQLDTNRVMVYAGDKLRFQLNSEGLFAYKSFFEDFDILKSATFENIADVITVNKRLQNGEDIESAQFVKMDANGLFLIAREGALVLNANETNYLTIDNVKKDPFGFKRAVIMTTTKVIDGEEVTFVQQIYDANGKPYHSIYSVDHNYVDDSTDDRTASYDTTYTVQEVDGVVTRSHDIWYYNDDYELEQYVYNDNDDTTTYFENSIHFDATFYGTFELPETGIKRVAITWDGLSMSNYNNEKVFYADPDTGNLFIKGRLVANGTYIIVNNKEVALPKYLDDHVLVSKNLENIFEQTGKILSIASGSLKDIQNLNIENLSILQSFKENVAKNLTPDAVKGPYHNIKFKPGDVWKETTLIEGVSNLNENNDYAAYDDDNNTYTIYETLGTYVATAFWDEVYDSTVQEWIAKNIRANSPQPERVSRDSTPEDTAYAFEAFASKKGWTRTSDYRLAAITGAHFEMDTEAGMISIRAGKKIELLSAGTVYIGGGKSVDILSNQDVNIGGKFINIGAADIVYTNNSTASIVSGIRLVSSAVMKKTFINDDITDTEGLDSSIFNMPVDYNAPTNGSISRVFILPTGIEMAAKNGIIIKSGAGITIKAAKDSESVSVITLDNKRGIWIGSDQKISLFAGVSDLDETTIVGDNTTPKYSASGASIELSPTRLLFGVSDLTSSSPTNSVVDLTSGYLVAAVGSSAYELTTVISGDTSTPYERLQNSTTATGIVLTKDSFGIATSINSTRNLIMMDNSGVYIGGGQYYSSSSPNGADTTINDELKGAYVSIGTDGTVKIGATGNLYVHAANVALDTRSRNSSSTDGIETIAFSGIPTSSSTDELTGWNDKDTSIFGNAISGVTPTTNATSGINYSLGTKLVYFRLGSKDNPGLFFDGEDLYIRGKIFAKGIQVISVVSKTGEGGTTTYEPHSTNFEDYVKHQSEVQMAASTTLDSLFATSADVLQAGLQSIAALKGKAIDSGQKLKSFKEKIEAGLTGPRTIELYAQSSINIYTGTYLEETSVAETDSEAGISESEDTTPPINVLALDSSGIYLGSNQAINFYSSKGITTGSAGVVSIDSSAILLGVTSDTDNGAVQIQHDEIVLAVGNADISTITNDTGATTTLLLDNGTISGIKINRNKIAMASGVLSTTGDTRGVLSITPKVIQLGIVKKTGENTTTGSAISIKEDEIFIGSNFNDDISLLADPNSTASTITTGMLLQKSRFILAVDDSIGTNRNTVVIDDTNGIRLASYSRNAINENWSFGSEVKISALGVYIGTGGYLKVKVTNGSHPITIDTSPSGDDTTIFSLGSVLNYNTSGKLTISPSELTVNTSNVIINPSIDNSTVAQEYKKNYFTLGQDLISDYSNGWKMRLDSSGNLHIKGKLYSSGTTVQYNDNTGDSTSLDDYVHKEAEVQIAASETLTSLFADTANVIKNGLISIEELQKVSTTDKARLADFKTAILEGLTGKREIELYAASSIKIFTGSYIPANSNTTEEGSGQDDSQSTSSTINALSLDSSGIYLGSTAAIDFYTEDDLETTNKTSLISMNSNRILMGVTDNPDNGALRIAHDTIVLAVGNSDATSFGDSSITPTGNATGVVISRNKIALATGGTATNGTKGGLTIEPTKVELGIVEGSNIGSVIRIKKDEIFIGGSFSDDDSLADTTASNVTTGMLLKKGSFILATQDSSNINRNTIVINDNGIKMASYNRKATSSNWTVGSKIELSSKELKINSNTLSITGGILNVTTSNDYPITIKTNATGDSGDTTVFALGDVLNYNVGGNLSISPSILTLQTSNIILRSGSNFKFALGENLTSTSTSPTYYLSWDDTSGLILKPSSLTIDSSGTLNINTSNVKITENTFWLGDDSITALSYDTTSGLSITGNITASSFILNGSSFTDSSGNEYDLANMGGHWYYGSAITGDSTADTTYATGISGASIGDMYLNNDTNSNSYNNTYRCTTGGGPETATWVYVSNLQGATGDPGAPGGPGSPVTSTRPVYCYSSSSSGVGTPNSTISNSSDVGAGVWTYAIPKYVANVNYYSCEEYVVDGITKYSTPVINEALKSIINGANSILNISLYGLKGRTTLKDGTTDGTTYGLILGDTLTTLPMLIYSTGGIVIRSSGTGENNNNKLITAMTLSKDGITLKSGHISFYTNGGTGIDIYSSVTQGTDGSYGGIRLYSRDLFVNSGEIKLFASGGSNYITMNSNGITISGGTINMTSSGTIDLSSGGNITFKQNNSPVLSISGNTVKCVNLEVTGSLAYTGSNIPTGLIATQITTGIGFNASINNNATASVFKCNSASYVDQNAITQLVANNTYQYVLMAEIENKSGEDRFFNLWLVGNDANASKLSESGYAHVRNAATFTLTLGGTYTPTSYTNTPSGLFVSTVNSTPPPFRFVLYYRSTLDATSYAISDYEYITSIRVLFTPV